MPPGEKQNRTPLFHWEFGQGQKSDITQVQDEGCREKSKKNVPCAHKFAPLMKKPSEKGMDAQQGNFQILKRRTYTRCGVQYTCPKRRMKGGGETRTAINRFKLRKQKGTSPNGGREGEGKTLKKKFKSLETAEGQQTRCCGNHRGFH